MSKANFNARQAVYGLVATLLLIAGCICLVLGLIAAINWQVTPALSFMGAALVLLFAATIERFETLKGLGMEAKLTTLDIKISEANRLLEQIQMVAEITGKASLSMYARTGRIGGAPSHEEVYELIQKVNKSLISIGSTAETIKDAIHPCTRIMQIDLAREITKDVARQIQSKQHEITKHLRTGVPNATQVPGAAAAFAEEKRLEALREKLTQPEGIDTHFFPDNLVTLLRSALPEDFPSAKRTAEELEDFGRQMVIFRETGKLPDPEKWFAKVRPAFE